MKPTFSASSMLTIMLMLIIISGAQLARGQVLSEWRGPGRTGVYPDTNLLQEWPETGPELLWSVDSIYQGYSSVSIAHNTIYLTGLNDTMDMLMAFEMDGAIKWQVPYGRAWRDSYAHSRCTPTIEGNRVYLTSGMGDVTCMDAIKGNTIWSVEAYTVFEGGYNNFGVSESPLIVNDKIIVTPGGEKTTIVALDKMTGETVWASESLHDIPCYVSPLLVQEGEISIIVTVIKNYIIGVSPESGEILWKFSYGSFAYDEGRWNTHCNTPLYHDGQIFVTSGYNHRNVMLQLSEDLSQAYYAWTDTVLDVHHGGVVRIGEYIYGANWEHNRMGNWVCLDWNTGEVKYEEEWYNKGPIISSDGMLYCYEEKTGNIALTKATPDEFSVISTFKVPLGTGPHWSHPVIKDGILYIRHEEALMAYDIKEH